MRRIHFVALVAVAAAVSLPAAADTIRITEWQYNESEFVELTNIGAGSVDFAAGAYSFDDADRSPGALSLAGFGTVLSGESVLIVEGTAAAFRSLWNLSAGVKIIGGNLNNLSRSDEMNVYSGTTLIDRLTYGDQTFPGTIRTQNFSGIPGGPGALNGDVVTNQWILAAAGDAYGSYAVTGTSGSGVMGTFTGNPGTFIAPVPLPAAAWLLLSGLGALGVVRRRERAPAA